MIARISRSRVAAAVVAALLLAAAVAVTYGTVLRHHACAYDGLREWSEIALILTCFAGALAAAWCVVAPRPRLFGAAIACPVAVLVILMVASWRHVGFERACVARSLEQAAAWCGLVRGHFAVSGPSTDRVVRVRSAGPARQCLADWADWHPHVRVHGVTET